MRSHRAAWTQRENQILKREINAGSDIEVIAYVLLRTVGAVERQIRRLKDEKEPAEKKVRALSHRTREYYSSEPIGRHENDDLPSEQVKRDEAFQAALVRERPLCGLNKTPCTDGVLRAIRGSVVGIRSNADFNAPDGGGYFNA